jgi:hypothetical protein
MEFELDQDLAIVLADPKAGKIRLTAELQVMGLLRGDRHGGTAGVCKCLAVVASPAGTILSLTGPEHAVAGDENLSVNCRRGPESAPVLPGDHHLHQAFRIDAAHARGFLGTAAAAEFAPGPALDPTWISIHDPFRGVEKKEFGLRVTLRVEAE